MLCTVLTAVAGLFADARVTSDRSLVEELISSRNHRPALLCRARAFILEAPQRNLGGVAPYTFSPSNPKHAVYVYTSISIYLYISITVITIIIIISITRMTTIFVIITNTFYISIHVYMRTQAYVFVYVCMFVCM